MNDAHHAGMEEEIVGLLDELSLVQDELLRVVQAKRDLMAESRLEEMNQLHPREEALCERLDACHRRRAELLEQAQHAGLPSDSLGNLVATMPAENRGDLGRQVKEVAGRMRLLQHHSLTNWVLAQRSVLHLAQLLEIIATGGRLQPTYGKNDSSHSSGSLVDKEV